jgi:hypothetical protein
MYNISLFGIVTMNLPSTMNISQLKKRTKKRMSVTALRTAEGTRVMATKEKGSKGRALELQCG